MSQELWNRVEDYLDGMLLPEDEVLSAVLSHSAESGLPPIQVAPGQGALLHMLAKLMGARQILEVGTLGGYSSIWLGRALPEGGRLTTLEANDEHVEVARANIERAGLKGCVEILPGDARETLPRLAAERAGPFDMVFIDADKPGNPFYLDWALKLTRPGSLIVVDNVVRDGHVLNDDGKDANVEGVRKMLAQIKGDPRLMATALQLSSSKGYDGLLLALVRD